MPANLTEKYLKAERAFRRAATPDEELLCLQVMLRELPKHKGTDKMQADLKARISQTKSDIHAARTAPKKGIGIRIPRQGAGRVVLLGGPNAGKSQFVAATTNANPTVGEYPFTTREPSFAMMPFEDIQIQLIDLPPITRDLMDTTTAGIVRGADVCLLMLDLGNDDGWEQCCEVLDRFAATKTRLGRTSYLDKSDIGRSYTQTLLVPNKIDLDDASLRWEMFQDSRREPQGASRGPEFPDFDTFLISAMSLAGVPELQSAIWTALDMVRVYTKSPKEKQPDYTNPFTIPRGGTLADLAPLVHKDLADNLKFARVWGSAIHDGSQVKADYVLSDKDVVEIHV